MDNQLTTKHKNELTQHHPYPPSAPLASDLVIPYLLLSQAGSDLVKERKAQIGDFVRSTTGEKFGDPDKPCEIIFLQQPQTFWRIDQQVSGDKWRFLKTFPRNSSNEIMEFKYWGDKDGNLVDQGSPGALLHRRFKQFRVFGIMPADIAAARAEKEKATRGEFPDVSKALTPIILSLQSTSGYGCGKDITTFHTKCEMFQLPIYRNIVGLSCYLEKNDDGTFYCWKLVGTTPPKKVPDEDLDDVKRWAEIVNKRASSLRIDEAAETQVLAPTGVNQERVAEVC